MLPELQQYYEDRLSMMTTTAWSQLLEDLLEMRTQYENIRNCDAVTLEFRKGQVDILDYIIGLKDLSQQTYEELQNGEKNIWIPLCQSAHKRKVCRWVSNSHTVSSLYKWRY